MIYGSVCSGIEAATVAWHSLGWRAAFFSEIEAFPRAVLQHHYADVPLHGDFTTIEDGQYEPIDLLVGGTPCQDFSIAGLRAGMAGDRGNLTLQYLTLARRLRPRWLVWENVPGVLSSNGGRDFGAFLGGLGQLGYGWAYRTLDAQYAGVPQRRRRIFVVGYLGDWRYPAAVLFERHSLSGNPAPSREAGQSVASTFSAGTHPGSYNGQDASNDPLVAHSLRAQAQASHRADSETYVTHSLRGEGFDASEDATGRGTPLVPVPIDMRQASRGEKITNNRASGSGGAPGHGVGNAGDPAFTVSNRGQAIAFSSKDHGADASDDLTPTLRSIGHDKSHANAGGQLAVCFQESVTGLREYADAGTLRANGPDHDPVGSRLRIGSAVRRLTPRECERLQGFPDDYSLIPYRGKPAADGPRYKALGNSMAIPVMFWLGQRIQLVEDLCSSAKAAA